MDLSVAQGRPREPRAAGGAEATIDRRLALATGVLLALAAAAIYLLTRVDRFYDHFIWQAAAFLEGQAAIRYPVGAGGTSMGNWFFQDVLPIETTDGVRRGLLPFPPLPALLLVPFVAVWGITTDDQTLFTLLAAVDVAICWWMLGGLRIGLVVRLGTTLFFAFGTVFWYAAEVATTWYQAHIVAVGLTLVAIGLALRADPTADGDAEPVRDAAATGATVPDAPRDFGPLDRRQALIGGLFGLAATARLTVILGAPFFALVGAGGGPWRRVASAALGAAVPVLLLVAYDIGTTGQVLHPAYDHLYRLETAAYTGLGYRADWAVEDPRYLPQNAAIMFLAAPDLFPDRLPDSLGINDTPVCQAPGATRGLFDPACPLAVPRDVGMSVLLTSPAYLLLLPALGRWRRSRLVAGASLAVLLVVVVNLMHFSQGWVQFGYRFSLDAAPFALVLVALGWQGLVSGERRWAMPAAIALVVVSIAVNAWGVMWGRLLGW